MEKENETVKDSYEILVEKIDKLQDELSQTQQKFKEMQEFNRALLNTRQMPTERVDNKKELLDKLKKGIRK